MSFDVGPHPEEETAVLGRAGLEGVHDEGRATVEAVAQEKDARGQLLQQRGGERPFGLTTDADGRGQGIAQADLQQHGRGDLDEGGLATAALGFLEVGVDLRGVGEAELGAVQSDQAPAAEEGIGMGLGVGARTQRRGQHLGEHRPGEALAPLGQGTVRGSKTKETGEVFGQSAGLGEEVIDEGGQQLVEGITGSSAARDGQNGKELAGKERAPSLEKAGRRRGRGGGVGGWFRCAPVLRPRSASLKSL